MHNMSLIQRSKYILSTISAHTNLLLKKREQKIGLFSGKELSTHANPILSARDVTDYGFVSFVADPFLYVEEENWHLFFEVQNGSREPTAVIGHATSEDSGDSWQYDQVVLNWDCHLAFPFIFESNEDLYMVPGQGGDASSRPVTLFKAMSFPYDWQPVADLISPNYGPLDPIVFQHDGKWWLIVGGGDNDRLYAYYSSDLESKSWTSHSENPIVIDRTHAGRPAGRPLSTGGDIVIFLQDNEDQYGDKIRAYKITQLTSEKYSDEPISDQPWFEGTGILGWNSDRMHHIDLQHTDDQGWVCVTDGDIKLGRSITGSCWSIGGYTLDRSSLKHLGIEA